MKTINSVLPIAMWLAIFLSTTAYSQAPNFSLEEIENFEQRVKSLSDFIHIFNADFLQDSLQYQDSSYWRYRSRKHAILSIFDRNYVKDNASQETTSIIQEFIHQVVDDSLFLTLSDENWQATVSLAVYYHDAPYTIVMQLSKEEDLNNSAKWIIQKVEAPFLLPQQNSTEDFIPPNSSDLNFMDVGQKLNKSEAPHVFATKNYAPDVLTLFFDAIQRRELIIKHTLSTELTYQLTDNWSFKVKEFSREDINSGWLIANLTKL